MIRPTNQNAPFPNSDADLNAAVEAIRVRHARVHNLQNVDVDVPRDQFVVVTGLSGSGKSSLAFDTIYAEGQRQYIESLSAYARQFLQQLERPDVDLIDGLQPTVAIDQRAGVPNPRSTVATVTELYDYMRLLWARVGEARCAECGEPIRQQAPEQILEAIASLPPGKKAMLLAPFVRGRKGAHKDVLEKIRKAGFVRVRIDGEVHDIDGLPPLVRQKTHHIEAVVDRIVIREGIAARLADSLDLALRHGEGLAIVSYLEGASAKDPRAWHDLLFSTRYACPSCRINYEEVEPRTFSFNSPYGACPACEGLGYRYEFDPDLLVPDRSLSLNDGAVVYWRNGANGQTKTQRDELKAFAATRGFDLKTPLEKLRPKALAQLLYGDGKKFLGILTWLEQKYVTATRPADRQRLEAFRGPVTCRECGGSRLRSAARSVRVGQKAIHEVTAMTVTAAGEFFEGLHFTGDDALIAEPIVAEIRSRLEFLGKVGLDYLSLDRGADTLSGGEAQRIRLATGLGSALIGVCYILDEPSIGLHPRDNQRLIDALQELKSQGNSVIVVEHDEAMIRQADHVIDLGPRAGHAGGRIVAQGPPDEIAASADSLTGRYLAGELAIPLPQRRRKVTQKRSITIEGVTTNNLKCVSARFPLSALVCVTGVSGSGKSSLMTETLARAIARKLSGSGPKPGPHTSLRGLNQIDKLVEIDQSPIGRTPRSNPATYIGAFDEIRKVFANTRTARLRGYKAGRFSFNVKGGRCEACQGQGVQKIEMNFLPDLHVTCDECGGARFNRQTLEVRYRDKSIADVLDLDIAEAHEFFANFPVIARLLGCLEEVGLGYLALGQPSTMLSGGEAQRIKLAAELGRVDTGNTLYLLDEPTTGLHFDDIKQLLAVLNRLVERGNTVIVIEHNLDVIKTADWILDLGPEGGDRGGQLVGSGTPEEIAGLVESHTGESLRRVLEP